MTRKNYDPALNGNLSEETMSKSELKQHFTAIQADFNQIYERFEAVDKRFDTLENKIDLGFKRLESLCFAILEIVREHEGKFLNFEKRLVSLERKVV